MSDRQAVAMRPRSSPIMYQRWRTLLFLHWRVEPAAVQALLPRGLMVDQFDGDAWIGVTPFTMDGVRPPFVPALPLVSRTHELNVRTYVQAEGIPGVWFFSLDANNPLAVVGARVGFGLPYFLASMDLVEEEDEEFSFHSRRRSASATVKLEVRWRRLETLGSADPGTLDHFLIERYCLYARRGNNLYRSRIHHRPWQLRRASVHSLRSTMLSAQGLPGGEGDPLVHAQGDPLEVAVWPPERVGTG